MSTSNPSWSAVAEKPRVTVREWAGPEVQHASVLSVDVGSFLDRICMAT